MLPVTRSSVGMDRRDGPYATADCVLAVAAAAAVACEAVITVHRTQSMHV